jgi:predicted ribosomally synthesized peptide with nif11-like leader
MKTVNEFTQRLQHDPEFERKAQAFENNEDFMAFVKAEGYDFTLNQLLEELDRKPQLDAEVDAPPQKTVEEFIQRLQDDPEFEQKAQAFENNEDFLAFVKSEGYNFSLEVLLDGFNHATGSLDSLLDPEKAPQKSLEEFTQRLQNDPTFEKKAQSFNNSADFIAFLKTEGYVFTLDELLIELKRVENLSKPLDNALPAAIIPDSPPMHLEAGPEDPSETKKSCTAESCMTSAEYPSASLTQDSPPDNLPKPVGKMPLKKLDGIGGGGRRRGIRWKNADN